MVLSNLHVVSPSFYSDLKIPNGMKLECLQEVKISPLRPEILLLILLFNNPDKAW